MTQTHWRLIRVREEPTIDQLQAIIMELGKRGHVNISAQKVVVIEDRRFVVVHAETFEALPEHYGWREAVISL